jgi:hypothetical protein
MKYPGPHWDTNENDSMPIGNGDWAPNVWTEQNGGNPAPYVVFLYRFYAWANRISDWRGTRLTRGAFQDTSWGQDGTEASILELIAVAKKVAIAEVIDYGEQRFR